MKKEETIKRYGEAAYEKTKQQGREWYKLHCEKGRESQRLYRQNNPEKIKAKSREKSRKGGKYYERALKYNQIGLQHERILVRGKHGYLYKQYKKVIDPEGLTQIHHEWIPETPDFRGVALVEKNGHQHGYIDVIQILEGEITLLTEEEIKNKS